MTTASVGAGLLLPARLGPRCQSWAGGISQGDIEGTVTPWVSSVRCQYHPTTTVQLSVGDANPVVVENPSSTTITITNKYVVSDRTMAQAGMLKSIRQNRAQAGLVNFSSAAHPHPTLVAVIQIRVTKDIHAMAFHVPTGRMRSTCSGYRV